MLKPMHVSDYNDMVLVASSLKEGADIFVVTDHDELPHGSLKGHLCRISHILRKSDDPELYEKTESFVDKFHDYDYSGEFIEDDDCLYVFAKELDSI